MGKAVPRLSDIFPLHSVVEIATDVKIDIRPLQFTEIVNLLMQHKEAVLALYNESQAVDPKYDVIMASVPDMITDIIVLGADMADQREDVRLLPPGPQVQLLAAIWELSVPNPKKLIEALSKLMAQARRLAEQGAALKASAPAAFPDDTSSSVT